MYRKTFTSAAILCSSLSLFAGSANAQRNENASGQQPATQQPGQPQRNSQRTVAQATSSEESSQTQGQQSAARRDYFLASWIGSDNLTEIEVNQYAVQHASNHDVKNYAEEMVRVHTELAAKINQAIANESRSTTATAGRPYATGYRGLPTNTSTTTTARKTSEENSNENGQSNAAAGGQASNQPSGEQNGSATFQAGSGEAGASNGAMMAITVKREIGKQLLSMVEQKLGEKKGEDFDRCFMAGQVAAHMDMLATLEVARGKVSPEFKPVLDSAFKTVQSHLSHAESLVAQLEKK
jgi:predicted outer membrane protein